MHASDATIKTRLSVYECKQWLIQQEALVAENKRSSKQHCCVPLCHSNSSYDPLLSFHRFPSGRTDKKGRNSG